MPTVKQSEAKQKKPVKYPTKRLVNLAQRESNSKSVVTLVAGVCVIVVLAGCVAKFGVYDQLERQNAAERAYNQVHSQYTEMKNELEGYDDVLQEYRTYSRSWMRQNSSGQFVSVDRMDVLQLLEKQLMPCGTVNSVSVSGDVMVVAMSGMNLEEISAMFAVVQEQPIVASASLNIASTEKNTNAELDFSVTIVLQPAEEEAK